MSGGQQEKKIMYKGMALWVAGVPFLVIAGLYLFGFL